MKAALLKGKEQMVFTGTDRPAAGPGEVLLRVQNCGICGTDVHLFRGEPGSAEVKFPVILGHELSGIVEETGEGVTTLKKGDRVTVDPNIYCGLCPHCRRGRPHLCDRLQAVGVTRNGGMAEFAAVPEANCHVLPDNVSFEEGALVEPLGCVLHGVKQLRLSFGQSVLIIGGGFIGMLFLQVLRQYAPARLVVSEPVEAKHDLIRSFGADEVFHPKALRPEETFDIVVECVGRPETLEAAVRAACKGGQVLAFGVSSPSAEMRISPYEIFKKELTIKGSFINPHTHREAIELIRRGIVRLTPLISHRIGLSDVPDVLRRYPELGASKVMINC